MKLNTIIVLAIGILLAMWIAAVARIEPVRPDRHSGSPSETHP